MKTIFYFLLIFCLGSCRENLSSPLLAIQQLKYSAFYWAYNYSTNTREFYLDHYIEIDNYGKYKIMRRDNKKEKSEYFDGVINDSLRALIDSVLLNKRYKSKYLINMDSLVMYHGLTYCFDYENISKKILFIPPYSPPKLETLRSILDTLVMKADFLSTDTLNLEYYKSILANLDLPNLPPLPIPAPPPNKKEPRFEPSP